MTKSFFVFSICFFLSEVRTKNVCTTSKASELLANPFCRNGVNGERRRNCEAEVEAAQTRICCINPDKVPQCPTDQSNNNGDFFNPFANGGLTLKVLSLQNIQKQTEERLCPLVNGTAWMPCTYDKKDFTPEIEKQCTMVEQLNQFTECQQGCSETFPSKIPGIPSTGDGIDIDEIALIGNRTDAIGGQNEKRCGTRKFEEVILPENEAIMGEFPWVCSLFTRIAGNKAGKYLGGCAIIPNERDNDIQKPTYRVITAAAKMMKLTKNDPLLVRIRFTDNRLGNVDDDYFVSRFLTHPQYNPSINFANNIASLVLVKPINLVQEDGVNAACLPACNDMFDHTFINDTGVRCWAAGFGVKEENGEENFVLRKVGLPIYPNRTKCENIINAAVRDSYPGKRIQSTKLHDGEICAGGEEGKDTADGDGGTPLVCQAASGRWHVVGLTSWGVGVGVAGRPSIYTNVFHYLDFIYSVRI